MTTRSSSLASAWALCLASVLWLGLPVAALGQGQAFIWPDTTAPCHVTLQSCLNNVPDSSLVQIVIDNPDINQLTGGIGVLNITKSVHLRAASGFNPSFPHGARISGSFSGPVDVTIEGISLLNGGVIMLPQASAGTTSITIRRMNIEVTSSGILGTIDIENLGAGTTVVDIAENTYRRFNLAGLAISLQASAGLVEGRVRDNRVFVPDTNSSAFGMRLGSHADGTLGLSVENNHVHGSFVFGGICAVVGESSTPGSAGHVLMQNNVLVARQFGSGTGLCAMAGERSMYFQANNNTIVGYANAINLRTRTFSVPPSPAPFSGMLVNNLLAHNNNALTVNEPGASVSNHTNLFWDNNNNTAGTHAPAPGANSVFANPRLFAPTMPFLRPGSAAIGAANLASVQVDLPATDAAGGRRVRGLGLDIGAYEFGGHWMSQRATSDNINGNTYNLNHPALNGQPSARVLATPVFASGGLTNIGPFGVWYWGQWAIFNQDLGPMLPGVAYNQFIPAGGSGNFLHQASGGIDPITNLTDASVSGNPNAIIIATQNWNPPGSSGIYNKNPIAIGGSGGNWWIANSNGASIPNQAAFNVYAQAASPTAFVHQVDEFNQSGSHTLINHPQLNGSPCVVPQVTARSGDFDGREFDIEYRNDVQQWAIFTNTPGGVPEGSQFNVIFSGEQRAICIETIFADGFES